MKKILFFLLYIPIIAVAQSGLSEHIGLDSPPPDDAPICDIPFAPGSMDDYIIKEGEYAFDFTFYNHDGDKSTLSEMLIDKPVCVIWSSYTCPVFRGKEGLINSLYNEFSDEIYFFIMYTVEAHPQTDVSPYTQAPGREWVHQRNIEDGILFRQPTTYGERKALVIEMLSEMNLKPEVLIDGPCNEYWTNFGTIPNGAVLIDTSGKIFSSHAWLNSGGKDMRSDIVKLLTGEDGSSGGGDASFKYRMETPSRVDGNPGDIIVLESRIRNLSNDNSVSVKLTRSDIEIPSDWFTTFCTDVCLPPEVDEYTLVIPPGEESLIDVSFYTSDTPGEGSLRLKMENVSEPGNQFTQGYRAITSGVSSIDEPDKIVELFPNPASSNFFINIPEYKGKLFIRLIELTGNINKVLFDGFSNGNETLYFDINNFKSGFYLVEISATTKRVVLKLIVQ